MIAFFLSIFFSQIAHTDLDCRIHFQIHEKNFKAVAPSQCSFQSESSSSVGLGSGGMRRKLGPMPVVD
jgi:hypothetical protein